MSNAYAQGLGFGMALAMDAGSKKYVEDYKGWKIYLKDDGWSESDKVALKKMHGPRGADPVYWSERRVGGEMHEIEDLSLPKVKSIIDGIMQRSGGRAMDAGWFSTQLAGKYTPEILRQADEIHQAHKRGGIGEETMLARLKALGLSRKDINTLY